MHLTTTHIYSMIPLHLPVCHPSFLHLISLSLSCLPVSTAPYPPLHPTHPRFPTFSLACSFSPPLSLALSLPPPPLFLSIHATESLLIICDLLEYIHCHSLSLPFHFPFLPLPFLSLCPVFCSASSSHYSFPLPFPLRALSVPFVSLYWRIICVPLSVP